MNLFRAFATIGSLTMVSRVFGFARDILIAAFLGAGPVADAFFIAFKIPNLFRRLFAEGAFNAAFVPIYAGLLEKEGQARAQAFGQLVFSILLWTLLAFTLLMEIAMPWAMYLFAPGFADDPDKFNLAVTFTRITFPYLLFISLVSLFAGVLNSFGRFAAPAATPILLNITLIAAMLGLRELFPTVGHVLAWGVFAAGIIQFVWLLFNCVSQNVVFTIGWPKITGEVKTFLTRVVPGAVSAGIYQVNLVIDMVVASLLPTGAISFLFFADRVTQLPLGVVGVATGTALLPLLSRQLRAGDEAEAMSSQNRALEFSLLLTLPAAVALFVLAEPVVRVLFERGSFDPSDALATAAALAVYATGLPAYVLIKTLTPGYFARGDTKTPMLIAAVCLVINLVLNILLMGPFQHVGIAMATVASSWTNTVLLAWILRKRGQLSFDKRFLSALPRTVLACAGLAAALVVGLGFLHEPLSGSEWQRIWALAVLVVGGLMVFGLLAQITGAARLSAIKAALRGRPAS